MKASILIRTHNSQNTIEEVLEGVSSQSFTDYELIIVDSGSTDRTLRIVKNYPHTFVDYSHKSFSYGGSLNAGFEVARGEYVVCLSSHCVPLHERWLERLVEAMDSEESIAAAWGPLVFDTRDGVKVGKGVAVMDLEAFYREPNRGLQNSNSIVRRELWEGRGFSEEIERCEDQEWAHHFLKLGYKTALVREAPVLYRILQGPIGYGRKMMLDSLALREMFGDGPEISTASLLLGVARLVGAGILGRKAFGTSVTLAFGLAGIWLAGRRNGRGKR